MEIDRIELLEGIAMRRENVEDKKENIKEFEILVEQTSEFKDLQQAKDHLSQLAYDLASLEAEYREICLESYKETGEKQQLGGMIKIFKKYNYDEEAAIAWAVEHKIVTVLKLDSSAFKKVANSMQVEFVETLEIPRMTLSKDFSKWLEGDNGKS